MGGSTTVWCILALAALAVAMKRGYIHLPLSAQLKSDPASPPSGGSQAVARLDDMDPAALGLAFARAMKRKAEDNVVQGIIDKAGKTIEEAFTAPFSSADPGKNRPEDINVPF